MTCNLRHPMGLLHPVPRVNRLNTMCCRALQCVAVCSNVLKYEYLYTLCWQTEYNALQCVAACCSVHVCKNLYTLCSQTEYTVLHRVTVCCSVCICENLYNLCTIIWSAVERRGSVVTHTMGSCPRMTQSHHVTYTKELSDIAWYIWRSYVHVWRSHVSHVRNTYVHV